MAEEPAEPVALVVLRLDGSAAVLRGHALEDYMEAEGLFLSRGIHNAIFAPIAQQYSDAIEEMEETMWMRDWDNIIISGQDGLLREIEDLQEDELPYCAKCDEPKEEHG